MSDIITLFPCGLPIILNNIHYTADEQNRVIETCIKLQQCNICTDSMFENCAENYMDRLVEGQIRARESHNRTRESEDKSE